MIPQNSLQQKNELSLKRSFQKQLVNLNNYENLFKSIAMPNKAIISNFSAIEGGNTLALDSRSISKFFKNIFSNLVEFFLIKFPKHPNMYNLKSVIQYYSSFAITADICLVGTTEKGF